MNKNNLGPMIKSSIHSLSLIFILFVIVNLGMPVFAYDQPWNGFREDITSPDPDPDPPCPSGNCKCPPNGTRSPVYVADGSLVWSETDIQFPTNAQITLTRTYNSFDERSGLFGRGWVTAQESNIARTYRALDEGNADGSPSTATNFGSVPIWLASYGRRYVLQETATHCTPPSVLYFTFEKLADGKFKQVFDDNQSYSIFNENGVLLQTYSDSDGSSIYYVYDQQNRLTQQFDSFGFTLNFIYNDQGFVSEVNDQLGRTWSYSYDEFGRLVEVLDPDGNTRSYTYNLVDNIGYKQHFLTSINDNTDDMVLTVNWAQLAIGLNSQMRVSNYMESDGHRHDYTYTATTYAGVPAIRVNKNTKQVNSSATIETQTFYADASNYQVLYETNSTDSTSKTSKFDSRGNIIEEIDERGNVTQFQYNTQGRITTEIELAGTPQARTISITYWNNTDRVASYNEYGLKETRYTYDANLRVLTETEVDLVSNDQRITAYTYHANSTDAQGNLILGKVATIDGPLPGTGDIQTYAYSQQGLLTQLSNPLNQNVSYSYNAIGQLSSETDVNGVVTNYTYDSRNRVIQTERNNRIFKITYDTQGLIKQMIDELGRTTLIAYDTFNQVNRLDLASGDYKTYSYTYGSNYTEITERYYQANNTLVSSRVSRQDPISKLPLQVFLANMSQQVQNSTYNAYDDVVQKTLYGQFDSGTTSTTTYSYDNEGRLSRVVDHLSNVTDLAYDDFHRTTQVTDANNATTQYAYNAWGDLLQLNSQDTGLTNFQVDSAGNIISQTNANNQTTNFTFDHSIV
ncbi:MAG: DUF6531 domain-containing protein [Gammaproteobacteria bacterium]|nr:DUF6531 domain-containing protein [Gammaproteobacteria bacterium]